MALGVSEEINSWFSPSLQLRECPVWRTGPVNTIWIGPDNLVAGYPGGYW